MHEGQLRIWPIPISFIFLVLGLLNSKLLNPLNLAWIKFGELLGRIIAPIVMAIVYFLIITPIGLFMRLIGKDLLNTKFLKDNSYWITREKNIKVNDIGYAKGVRGFHVFVNSELGLYMDHMKGKRKQRGTSAKDVSYTHLTLPTKA